MANGHKLDSMTQGKPLGETPKPPSVDQISDEWLKEVQGIISGPQTPPAEPLQPTSKPAPKPKRRKPHAQEGGGATMHLLQDVEY